MRGKRGSEGTYDVARFGEVLQEFLATTGWSYRKLALAVGVAGNKIEGASGSLHAAAHGARVLPRATRAAIVDVMVATMQHQGEPFDIEVLPEVAGLGAIHRSRGEGAKDITAMSSRMPGEDEFMARGVPGILAVRRDDVLRELLQRYYRCTALNQWGAALQAGLAARALFERGSSEWGLITLLQCAMVRQQRGDVIGTQRYLREVRDSCLDMPSTEQDPVVQAAYLHIQGWVEAEQLGAFESSIQRFRSAAQVADAAGDQNLALGSLGWALIASSHLAMAETDAWVGATPTKPPNLSLLRELERTLSEDWPAVGVNPESSMHLYRRISALALVNPGSAREELLRLNSEERRNTARPFAALTGARWLYSQQAWEGAAEQADLALGGYVAVSHPPGIAYSSLVRGAALLHTANKRREYDAALDGIVLTLLMHPYRRHPVFLKARALWNQCMTHYHYQNPEGAAGYTNDLDLRVNDRDGVFSAVEGQEIIIRAPTVHLESLTSASLSSLFSFR